MKKILTILLVISFFVNSIPISQFGKLVAFENTDNQTKEILSETTEGSNEIEYEITSLRGPNYKAFKTKDGMIEYNYYDENIHYLNESGEYIEYDVTLSETNNSYSNIVNNYEVILPKNLKKDNIILKYQDDILKIKYLSNSNKKEKSSKKENKKDDLRTLTKQSSKVEYKNVLKHTTIELIHTPNGLKENLILDKYIENYSFSYILETNLELVYENETLYLYNEVEEEIFRFNPYNIIDNLGNIYYDVNLNIIKIDNGYQIEVIPNDELLQELEYPVIIDPVITYSGAETRNFIRAKYMRKDFLGSTEGIKLEKYIRYYEDSYGNVLSEDISTYTVMEINRSLLNQEYDLSALKYGKLSLKILSTTYENAYEIGVSEITRFHLNNVITPFYDYEDIDGFTVYTKEHIGTLKRKNNIYEMDISDLLREKYKEKILLELSPDKLGENENNVIFFGPNYSDLTKTPIMTLGFLDNKGLVNYLTYHTVSTDNTTAYINDCFGNLVIEQTDYISNSNKTSFNIKHYYNPNGFLQNLGYGYGFRISYLEQLITDNLFDQEYYYIFDSTGRKKYYIKGETTQQGTKYISEEGEDEYLLINDTVSKKIVEERYHYTYDNEGYLTNIVDIKYPDIYINITYNSVSDKKIKEITDSTGNIAKFLYTNSLLSSIEIYKKAFDNSGNKLANEVKVQTISYQYNSGDHLENIIYQVGNKIVKKESFEYNGLFITNATSYDVNSNNEEKLKSTISFEMDYLKVIKYTQQIGSNSLDEKNIEMNISYSNRTTTFTNNLGVTTKYLFDYFGHTQTIIDNFGNTVFYKYANYNGELYKDNPNYIIKHQLIEVSEPINNGYNLIDNHSFENGTTNWDIYSGIIDHISAYGKKALKSYQEIYQEKTLIARQKITIESGRPYKVKALIQGEGEIEITSDNVNHEFYHSEVTLSNEEYYYEREFALTNSDVQFVDVYVNLYAKPTTKHVYFDQIQIDKNNIDTTYNLITNPSFEENNSWIAPQENRIFTNQSHKIFGNFQMMINPNSSISQTIEGIEILEGMVLSLGGYISTNGSEVELRVTLTNTTNTSSNTYVIPFVSYLLDYQYRLDSFKSDNTYNKIKIEIVNTGKNPCYVDNLILTKDIYNTKYEYNTIGKLSKKTIGKKTYEYEYANDNRTLVMVKENDIVTNIDISSSSTTITKDNISVTENKNQYNQTTSSQINNNTVSTNIYGYDNQYITSQTGIDNTEISYTYDYLYGLLTSVTNNNVTTSYEYDEYKRLFKTNFTIGSIKYIYDDFGNIIKVSVLNNNTELLSYFFEYNNHFDIESIYIGKDTTKEHLISYEYYYKPSTSNTKIYTGLIEKVIKGKNQEYYERYEYNEEYDLYKTYIKKPTEEEQLVSKVLYDNYKNISLYEDYIDNKTYFYNYDYQNRLISCLDQNGNGVKYSYTEEQEENSTTKRDVIIMDYIVEDDILTTLKFTYDKDELIKVMNTDLQSDPKRTIDEIGRSTKKVLSKHDNTDIISYEYTYNSSSNEELSTMISSYQTTINNIVTRYEYTYDSFYNITNIKKYENNIFVEEKFYQYNDKNELIIETIMRDYSIVLVTGYTYDTLGNITSITRQTKQEEYSTLPYQITLSYNDNTNPTKLTSYTVKQEESSTGITYNVTYDNFGNIINDGQNQYTYDIDKLMSITTNNKNIIYEYNSSGIRTYKKIINPDNTYEEIHYEVSGDMILQERRFNSSTNTTTYIRYIYDETGVVGFKTGTDINNLTTYYFVKNMQNDIVEIIDTNLNSVVKYTYDAYGNVFISGTLSSTIGELNPYRYRGYYYDEETKTYYCNSRYYSPELCRFISPDDIEYLDPESINGLNLYAYCGNNPVMYVDSSGNFPVIAFIIGGIAVGAVVSVIVVLGVKSCTSENTEKEKTSNDLADAIVSNIDPKVLVDSTNGLITNNIGNYPANSLPIQPHGEGGYEIPNGNYNSYSGGRAVFDSTYEEDLFDVILSLKIWG